MATIRPQGTQGIQYSSGIMGPTGTTGSYGIASGVAVFTGPTGPYPKYIPDNLSDTNGNHLAHVRYTLDKPYGTIKYKGSLDSVLSVLLERILDTLNPHNDGKSVWGAVHFDIVEKQLNITIDQFYITYDEEALSIVYKIQDKLQRMYALRSFL